MTERDLEILRPARRAGRVAYPTREQAELLGLELYRLDRPLVEILLRRGVTGAAVLAVMGSGSCGLGDNVASGAPPGPTVVSEVEARMTAQRIFLEAGISLEESYQYTVGTVDFNADGFDPALGVGYDYHSVDDSEIDEEYCDPEEALTLAEEMEAGGDAVKIIRNQGLDHYSELQYLETQLEGFITWLRDNGRI
jgi:hypothetical protein